MLTGENHFQCDYTDEHGVRCDVNFYYDPGQQGAPTPPWDKVTQDRLAKIVSVVYPIARHTQYYCCDAHAILAMAAGQHLPALPSKITGATEADLNNAKRAMKVVDGLRTGPGPALVKQ